MIPLTFDILQSLIIAASISVPGSSPGFGAEVGTNTCDNLAVSEVGLFPVRLMLVVSFLNPVLAMLNLLVRRGIPVGEHSVLDNDKVIGIGKKTAHFIYVDVWSVDKCARRASC